MRVEEAGDDDATILEGTRDTEAEAARLGGNEVGVAEYSHPDVQVLPHRGEAIQPRLLATNADDAARQYQRSPRRRFARRYLVGAGVQLREEPRDLAVVTYFLDSRTPAVVELLRGVALPAARRRRSSLLRLRPQLASQRRVWNVDLQPEPEERGVDGQRLRGRGVFDPTI